MVSTYIHAYSLANLATLAEPLPVQNIQTMLLILNLLIHSFSERGCKAANIDMLRSFNWSE